MHGVFASFVSFALMSVKLSLRSMANLAMFFIRSTDFSQLLAQNAD